MRPCSHCITAFVHPYLYYCIHVWGKAYSIHLNDLVVLQNKAMRIISVPPRINMDKFYIDMNILTAKLAITTILDYSCIDMYSITSSVLRYTSAWYMKYHPETSLYNLSWHTEEKKPSAIVALIFGISLSEISVLTVQSVHSIMFVPFTSCCWRWYYVTLQNYK